MFGATFPGQSWLPMATGGTSFLTRTEPILGQAMGVDMQRVSVALWHGSRSSAEPRTQRHERSLRRIAIPHEHEVLSTALGAPDAILTLVVVASSRGYSLGLERSVSVLRALDVDGAGVNGLATSLYPPLSHAHASRLGRGPHIGISAHRTAANPCALVRRVAVCLGAAKDLEEVSASPRWIRRPRRSRRK